MPDWDKVGEGAVPQVRTGSSPFSNHLLYDVETPMLLESNATLLLASSSHTLLQDHDTAMCPGSHKFQRLSRDPQTLTLQGCRVWEAKSPHL